MVRDRMQKESYQNAFLFLFAVGVFVSGYLFFINRIEAVGDEPGHCRQIAWILLGYELFPLHNPYLPIYHWSMVILYWITHFHLPLPNEFLPDCDPRSIFFFPSMIRLLSSVVSFATFIIFFLLAKKVDKGSAFQKSMLFLLFPLIFPFFFLIYTDLSSMLYVLLALIFTLKQRLWLAGIIGILSCVVRQNNILWLVFMGWLAYLENYYPQYRWKDIKPWISRFFFFFLALVLMLIFLIWNQGFVLGDKQHHSLVLNLDSLFFMLVLFFFLFLPQNLANALKIIAFLKNHPGVGWFFTVLFLIYTFFFRADHLYNSLSSIFSAFLHNWVLEWMRNPSFLHKTISFLTIAYSLLSICVTRLQRKSFYWLYPFTLLFIIPDTVLEIRYFFIPFTLFLLFRERDSTRTFFFTLTYYLIFLTVIMVLMLDRYFP